MSTQAPITRPGGVTLVLVLMWIAAIIEILFGLLIVATSGDTEVQLSSGQSQSAILWLGIITIVLGIITILLAVALAGGSNTARILVTILIVLQILSDAWELTMPSRSKSGAIIGILLWLIVLGLLWTSRASQFFKQPR